MRDQILRARSFSRRAFFVTAAKMFLMSSLAMRLYYLQITESDKYKTLSDDNRIRLKPILPQRGKILDRYGKIIAENQKHYKVWLNPNEIEDPEKIFDKLAAILEISSERYFNLFTKLTDKPKERLLVAEHVDWNYVTAIEVNNTELPGVEVDAVEVRSYPLDYSAAHLLGYVSAPQEEEVKNASLFRHEDFKIGRSGIERVFESELRGKAGILNLEVNAYGLAVRELEVENAIAGNNVKTSIDADLQRFTYDQIKDKGGVKESGGSVIVMDVKTGEVVSMVSTPGFDTNQFVQGINNDDWGTLTNHPDNPLINKCVSTQFAPGSTFKIIVALAALKKGVINENTRAYCPGYMDYGDRRFHCWNDRGHGQVNLRDAIAQSCNVYFYKIAQDVGIDAISEMSMRFGLGEVTNIELPSEAKGLVPTKEWKRKVKGADWYVGETINSSIGQGYLLTTPLQLVKMAAQVANGGYLVTPTILKADNTVKIDLENADKEKPEDTDNSLGISKRHLRLVQKGMERVINNNFGTAYKSRIKIDKYKMAGKTGTVQVRHRVEDKDEEIPRKFKNHALFVGYAPIDDPKYAISVVIEHGGSGSFTAAPIAKEVMLKALQLRDEKKKS